MGHPSCVINTITSQPTCVPNPAAGEACDHTNKDNNAGCENNDTDVDNNEAWAWLLEPPVCQSIRENY